jgi:hypothetical protein
VRIEDLGQIGLGLLNQLLELDHLADLLVSKHLVLLISVDSETGGIIATVFEAGEACWGHNSVFGAFRARASGEGGAGTGTHH